MGDRHILAERSGAGPGAWLRTSGPRPAAPELNLAPVGRD